MCVQFEEPGSKIIMKFITANIGACLGTTIPKII